MVYFFQQPVPNGKGWVPNLSPALPYGAFHFIFDSADRPYADAGEAQTKLESRLRKFNPDEDYLCWPNAGDMFSVYMVIAYLTRMGIEAVNMLVWQRARNDGTKPGHYVPTSLILNPRAA